MMDISFKIIEELLDKLEYWHGEDNIGEIFLPLVSEFEVFQDYIEQYSQLYKFLKAILTLEQFEGQTTDLLIAPVQRLPHMILILKDIVKVTSIVLADAVDVPRVVESLKTLISQIDKEFGSSIESDKICKTILKAPFVILANDRISLSLDVD